MAKMAKIAVTKINKYAREKILIHSVSTKKWESLEGTCTNCI